MKKKFVWISLKILLVVFLSGSLLYLYATELTPQDKKEFIEIKEEVTEGDFVTKQIPAIEDPCAVKGNAKEEAKKYVEMGKKNKWRFDNIIDTAKSTIKEIKAKKFDDIGHLSTMIELSLYNWACKNNYKLHNVSNGTPYFFIKDKGQGIFICMRGEEQGYISEGLTKGYAELPLDVRFTGTYYLYVVITKLNPEPNEKSGTELNGAAKKILDDIVTSSYTWGLDYYNTIIEEATKK